MISSVAHRVTHNGKSIGEERAILQTIPKETEPEQKFFPLTKIQKIS